MKRKKGCLKKFFYLVMLLVMFSIAGYKYFNPQTIQFYIRYFILQQMFKGPLKDWWGEMVRTALVERREQVVYAGMGTSLGIFEINHRGHLKLIKKIPLLGFVHGLFQEGNLLYAASGNT